MSVSGRPSGRFYVPTYQRQKRKGKPDAAITRIAGKRIYLGLYGTEESRAKFAELIAKPSEGSNSLAPPTPPIDVSTDTPTDPTIIEMMAGYLDYVDEYYGHKSAEWYHTRSFMKIMRQHFGDTLASKFKAKRLKQFRQHCIAKGWTRRYVNEHCARVKRMYKWAASEELVPTEVHDSLCKVAGLRTGKCQAPDNDPVEPVDDAVVAKTLECLSERMTVLVQVQRLCGCRPGELLKIRKQDIDRSGDVWVVKLKKHKTASKKKLRFIHFGPRAQELLLPRLVCGDDERLFPVRRDSYNQAVTRAAKRAGVEHWFPNQLRHSAGTEAREELGLEAAQVHLGHSRCDTTQIYAETSKNKAAEVARKIG